MGDRHRPRRPIHRGEFSPATFQSTMHSCHTTKRRASWSGHLQKLADYNQGTAYRAQYQLHCSGNYGGNIGILQSLHQVDLTNAHNETERTPYVSLSGSTEPIQSRRWLYLWYHHYKSESKQQSMAWWCVNSPPNKTFKKIQIKWYVLSFGWESGDPSQFPRTWTNHQLWPLCCSAD